MPNAPTGRTYSADDSNSLRKAAEAIDINPPLNDAGSWLEWAYTMMDEAASAMSDLEGKCDELKSKLDKLEDDS